MLKEFLKTSMDDLAKELGQDKDLPKEAVGIIGAMFATGYWGGCQKTLAAIEAAFGDQPVPDSVKEAGRQMTTEIMFGLGSAAGKLEAFCG